MCVWPIATRQKGPEQWGKMSVNVTLRFHLFACQFRLTFGVAEVASEASNLSEARRGARISFSFPARIRASE